MCLYVFVVCKKAKYFKRVFSHPLLLHLFCRILKSRAIRTIFEVQGRFFFVVCKNNIEKNFHLNFMNSLNYILFGARKKSIT